MDQSFSILIDGGGFLGIYAENISRENMGRYHVNQVRGVGVTQVIKDSPAEKAGLAQRRRYPAHRWRERDECSQTQSPGFGDGA